MILNQVSNRANVVKFTKIGLDTNVVCSVTENVKCRPTLQCPVSSSCSLVKLTSFVLITPIRPMHNYAY